MVTHEELCKSGEIHGSQYDRRKLPGNVWRPILTSPRDGTPIIVAKFGKNEIGEDCGFWWISKGHFDAERQCWHDGIERLSWPTHWMPVAYPVSEGLDELLKEDDATKARRYATELHDLQCAIKDVAVEMQASAFPLPPELITDEQRGWNKATDYIIDLLKKHCGDMA